MFLVVLGLEGPGQAKPGWLGHGGGGEPWPPGLALLLHLHGGVT